MLIFKKSSFEPCGRGRAPGSARGAPGHTPGWGRPRQAPCQERARAHATKTSRNSGGEVPPQRRAWRSPWGPASGVWWPRGRARTRPRPRHGGRRAGATAAAAGGRAGGNVLPPPRRRRNHVAHGTNTRGMGAAGHLLHPPQHRGGRARGGRRSHVSPAAAPPSGGGARAAAARGAARQHAPPIGRARARTRIRAGARARGEGDRVTPMHCMMQ